MASHSRRVLLAGIFAALPATIFALLFVWLGDFTPKVQWSVSVLVVGALLLGILVLQERVVLPLQTVSNLLAALREGDYSLRARGATPEDPLGLVYLEANALRDTLRSQRLGALEATALLRTVVAEVDVAVLSFDEEGKLGLVNRAGERLLGSPPNGFLDGTPRRLGSPSALRAIRREWWSGEVHPRCDGNCGAPVFAREARHTSCWCWPM